MTLIEQTKEWIKEHMIAGRELEALASEVRLKTLERCEAKKHKPEFILNMASKAEANVLTFSHMSRRSDNHEHYVDDVLVNQVVLKAVTDFMESRN